VKAGVGSTLRRYALPPLLALVSWTAFAQRADPASDAPDGDRPVTTQRIEARSYGQALRDWRSADDVNAWIGARFTYDMSRAIALSETQRGRAGAVAIHSPEAFFDEPSGICVDLARFAVETLRRIDPAGEPRYLMIEFSPASIAGNTLRLHWVATFQRDGGRYVFADSKRPGHVAGPYADLRDFIAEYTKYRGREIVAFREVDSYQRARRTPSAKRERETRP
jgi:hypothetical protein